MKALKLQIKDEIALLRQTKPEKAKEIDEFIFGTKGEIDEASNMDLLTWINKTYDLKI